MATININLGIAAVAGGTVDALTITLTPAVVPYNLMPVFFRSSGPNLTTTPTANVNASVAMVITKKGGEALVAGDIDGDHIIMLDVANNRWELLNPASDEKDTYWEAGLGPNSLKDKRSSDSSAQDGLAIGNGAINSSNGNDGQAIGSLAENSENSGQAIGAAANNSGHSGQAIGNGANNSGLAGQSIGEAAVNTGEGGQALGSEADNQFERSTAIGYQSVSTAADQMNLAQTLRLQAYAGVGTKILQHDNDGIVSGSNALPSDTTAATEIAGNNSTRVATTEYVDRVNVQSVASAATVTATAANDLVVITAQAAGLTLANPTGTWQQGQALAIRIKDNGTSRTIAYGAKFRALGTTLPTATTISKTVYLFVIYNSTDDTFDVTGVSQQA